MKPYEDFRQAIARSESSNNYQCVNQLGYVGRYQFGLARLCDLGLTERRQPESKSMANRDFCWKSPLSQDLFLRNQKLQDQCFDRHVKDLRRQCESFYTGDNWSGAVAACHLVGREAFEGWIKNGKEACDANGVSVAAYYERFRGYSLG